MRVAVFVLAVVFGMGNPTIAGEAPMSFRITTRKQDDRVEVRSEKDRSVFVVTSPSGISHAIIERTSDAWPKAVVLRLRLKGLESLTLASGTVTLAAAVSVSEGKPQVRQWKDGKEDAPLDEKSPFWMDIRILEGEGKPARELPLKEGWFEIAVPRALLTDNPKTFQVRWIDFFRG